MTISEAIKILDPDTALNTIAEIRYYGGLRGREKARESINEACRLACDIMRRYNDDMR